MVKWPKKRTTVMLKKCFRFAQPTIPGNHALLKTPPNVTLGAFGLQNSMEPGIVLVNPRRGMHENERRGSLFF
jgi:hypothetical protein